MNIFPKILGIRYYFVQKFNQIKIPRLRLRLRLHPAFTRLQKVAKRGSLNPEALFGRSQLVEVALASDPVALARVVLLLRRCALRWRLLVCNVHKSLGSGNEMQFP